MIKSFEEWNVDGEDERTEYFMKTAYEAGVSAASEHFEEEKVAIHEYYDFRIRELMGSAPKEPVDESNNGRLV